jgi:hypothetical protein
VSRWPELRANHPSYPRSRTLHQTCSSSATSCRTGGCLRE